VKKNTGNIIIWSLFYSFVFVFLIYNSFSYLDPDLGWHLKVGQQIAAERAVPGLENYNYTLSGKSWVDHEWLANLIIFLIYDQFGYLVLSALFALLIILILIILNRQIKKICRQSTENSAWLTIIIIILEILGVIAVAPHIGVRIQEVGLLFLLLLLLVIQKFESAKNWKTLLWLLPILYFWSCLHGSFLISLFILGFWIFIKIIERLIAARFGCRRFYFLNFENKTTWLDIKNFAWLASAAIASTFFTPYGFKLYSFLADYTDNFYAEHIVEWLPVFTFPFSYAQMFYLSTAIAVVLIYCLNFHYSRKKNIAFTPSINLWQLGLFFVFLFLAFKSRRHFPLFFIVSLPIIVQIIFNEFQSAKINFNLFRGFLIKFYLLSAILLAAAGLILKTNFTNEPFLNKNFCQTYPCAAINFLKNNGQYSNLRLFNDYNWGGFMIWTWPGKKIFTDGRLPQYPYNNHTLLEEYYAFFDEKKTEERLDQHNIELVLLKIEKPRKIKRWEQIVFGIKDRETKNNLSNYLSGAKTWRLVYTDDISQIYVKNNNANQ